jgi:hypothetical protein
VAKQPSPLYVSEVSGTVKGELAVKLAPKTLIVGPNGSGKTAITNAVELALSGFARDVAGRPDLKAADDLIMLAPPDEPLHAVARLSDGRSAAFRVERNGPGKVKRPAHAPVDGLRVVYPFQEAQDAARTPERAQAFLLAHAGEKVDRAAVLDRLPSISREVYSRMCAAGDAAGASLAADGLAELLVVENAAKARKRSLSGEIKGANATLAALTAGADITRAPVDDAALTAEIEALQQEARELAQTAEADAPPAPPANPAAVPQARRPTVEDALKLHQQAQALQQQHLHAQQQLEGLQALLAQRKAELPAEPAENPTIKLCIALHHVMSTLRAYHDGTARACPVCAGPLTLDVAYSQREANWQNTAEALTLAQAQLRQSWLDATVSYRDLERQVESTGGHLDGLREQYQRTAQAYGAIYEALQQGEAEPTPEELAQQQAQAAAAEAHAAALAAYAQRRQERGARHEQIAARVRELNAARSNAAHQRGQAEAAGRARDAAASLDREESEIKALLGHIEDVRRSVTTDLASSFTKRVQAYLPDVGDFTFGVRPRPGDSAACDFGFVRGDALHVALSGAERNLMILALAGVCAADAGEGALCVTLAEERAYDEVMLGALMRALSSLPGQIILTSPLRPKGKKPAGWAIVEAGAPPAAAEAGEES